VALTAEIADGWLPILFSPQHYEQAYGEQVREGFAKAANGKSLDQFDIAPSVSVVIDDDLETARNQLRPMLALYIGGMGAKGKNFYNDLAVRYGFEEAAATIQDAYLVGDRGTALMAVPDALIDAVALVGPKARIAERLALWKDSPITTMNITVFNVQDLRTMAELVL
jgi:alkanesulfonate monooxygenase SsuD/methylene tetrahydromethanopterin reductase-like flavin-dependent oxidoreductase (luciferase family)